MSGKSLWTWNSYTFVGVGEIEIVRVIKEGLPSICSILFLVKRMHYYLCNKMHLDNNGKTIARNTDPALVHSINAYWENGDMKISMLSHRCFRDNGDKTGAAYITPFFMCTPGRHEFITLISWTIYRENYNSFINFPVRSVSWECQIKYLQHRSYSPHMCICLCVCIGIYAYTFVCLYMERYISLERICLKSWALLFTHLRVWTKGNCSGQR